MPLQQHPKKVVSDEAGGATSGRTKVAANQTTDTQQKRSRSGDKNNIERVVPSSGLFVSAATSDRLEENILLLHALLRDSVDNSHIFAFPGGGQREVVYVIFQNGPTKGASWRRRWRRRKCKDYDDNDNDNDNEKKEKEATAATTATSFSSTSVYAPCDEAAW